MVFEGKINEILKLAQLFTRTLLFKRSSLFPLLGSSAVEIEFSFPNQVRRLVLTRFVL